MKASVIIRSGRSVSPSRLLAKTCERLHKNKQSANLLGTGAELTDALIYVLPHSLPRKVPYTQQVGAPVIALLRRLQKPICSLALMHTHTLALHVMRRHCDTSACQ